MKVNSIEEYLGTLQGAMVETWKSHLKTDKYSDHKALNEFYDEIVELVDALIEEYQGIYGRVKDLKNMMSTDKQSALDYLESLREMTREGKSLFKEDELKSDIDAILSLLDSTIYKLKELKEDDQHKGMKSLSSYLTERLNESHSESEKNNSTIMKDLKDFLNESLIDESIDTPSAEKIVFDLLYSKAERSRFKVDDDKLRDLANAIVDVFDEEDVLYRVSKSNFKKYLEDNSYFNILSAADTSVDKKSIEDKDRDLIYTILDK